MFEVETVSSKYERFNIRWGMKVTLYKIGLLIAKYKL